MLIDTLKTYSSFSSVVLSQRGFFSIFFLDLYNVFCCFRKKHTPRSLILSGENTVLANNLLYESIGFKQFYIQGEFNLLIYIRLQLIFNTCQCWSKFWFLPR